MTRSVPIRRQVPGQDPGEDGYILVAVIFMLAILIISLAVAAPRVRESIQRDREQETMRRGLQYVRAIQLYYRKFGSYPPNVDALVKTNEIRFLRKRYIDPTTGKDDWKPIAVGQNKTPIMGFFGQPLAGAGSPIGGTGPGGVTGATPAGSAFGSPTGSAFGSTTGSAFGASSGSPLGSTDGSTSGSAFGSAGASASPSGGLGLSSSTPGAGTPGSSSPGGPGSSSDAGGSAFGGQTFGGAGIMGFSPASPKPSLLVYKKKNHYNEWEFLYSPLLDQMMSGGATGAVGQPATGQPGTGVSGGFGTTGIGTQPGSGFGLSPGPGSPTSPTAPTTPTPTPAPQQ